MTPVEFSRGGTSWERADPLGALLEVTGSGTVLVTLPDGGVHEVCLASTGGGFVGWCDCNGWQYHDGACAHLCTVRKAAFGGVEDTAGRPVRIPPSRQIHRPIRTDGGRPDHVDHVDPEPAGSNGREFGRPEGRL